MNKYIYSLNLKNIGKHIRKIEFRKNEIFQKYFTKYISENIYACILNGFEPFRSNYEHLKIVIFLAALNPWKSISDDSIR